MTPIKSASPAMLPHELLVSDFAERARAAGLAFVNESTLWEKPELVAWLIGTYGDATRVHQGSRRGSAKITKLDPVETGTLESVLTDARVRALSALEGAAISRDPTAFARAMAARNVLLPIVDRNAKSGWMPVDVPRMRLVDRVLSLFAADALTRPDEFTKGLYVCHRCERVRIDAGAREAPCVCEAKDSR
jgi:hypothetical protein